MTTDIVDRLLQSPLNRFRKSETAGSAFSVRLRSYFLRRRARTGAMLSRAASQTNDSTVVRAGKPLQLVDCSGSMRDWEQNNSSQDELFRPSNKAPSGRMMHLTSPLTSRTVNASRPTFGAYKKQVGSLQALYERSAYIDGQRTTSHDVFVAEEDISDYENLEFEFQASPVLLQAPSVKFISRDDAHSLGGEPPKGSATTWLSSHAAHFFSSKSVKDPTSAPAPLKRELSKETDAFEASLQKKPKKRVLPATFQAQPLMFREKSSAHDQGLPAPKPQSIWDTSKNTVKQQKQLKNQQVVRQKCDRDAADVSSVTHATQLIRKQVDLSEEQNHILHLVRDKNASVFFTGPAGSGKSVLMRSIICELKKKYARDSDRLAVTASTGLAACNIGGITLHSFSGIGLGKENAKELVKKIRRNQKAKNRWLKVKSLIIDEISMVDGELFDKLEYIARVIRSDGRPWGGIQLIITGDFFQLPPVPDSDKHRDAQFAFDASTWSTSIDHTIGLTQVFRQRDPIFAQMLNEMRVGMISDKTVSAFRALQRPLNFDDGIESAQLYPLRTQVDSSNHRRLRELSGTAYRYNALDSGDPSVRDKLLANMMAPKSLELKIDAQVMLIKNFDETLVNGSLGRVVAFADEKTYEMTGVGTDPEEDEDTLTKAKRKLQMFSNKEDRKPASDEKFPVVQFVTNGGAPRTMLCIREDWTCELPDGTTQAKRSQVPLILAWALSIHKAQGQTLERVTVNLAHVFEKGQAYVALSRATTQQGLRVLGFQKSKVMAHERVRKFYDKLYTTEQANRVLTKRTTIVTGFLGNKNGFGSQAWKR